MKALRDILTVREVLIGLGGLISTTCAFIFGLSTLSPRAKFVVGALFFVGIGLTLVAILLGLYPKKDDTRSCLVFSSPHLREPIASGNPPEASISIKNTGQVSAYNLRITLSSAFLGGKERNKARKGKLPKADQYILERDGETIDAGRGVVFYSTPSNAHISSGEISSVENDTLTFYVWGEVLYDDMYGNDRSCRFCAFTNDINSTELTRCS